MSKLELAKILVVLRTAYPNQVIAAEDKTKDIWYEMLKDLEYETVIQAVEKHVKTKHFAPSISELRGICKEGQYAPWSAEWHKLLNEARCIELNEPGQYALKTITRDHFESCLCNPSRVLQCMEKFERLYKEYMMFGGKEKEQLKAAGIFIDPFAQLPMQEEEEEVGDDW